ncbi:MAG: glycosyltransferase [Patescibacteria group bacterium]|nr:glycosyltransferase [Patescibacteria group bacterium]MCL5431582.1 glycosyltransferase [Patescibacteria group bacterium]
MKLLYITNSRLPTSKAHGVQIAKMCEALIENGINLQLIIPRRNNSIKETIEQYYDLRVKISFRKLLVIDLFPKFDSFAFVVESLTFYLGVLLITLVDQKTKVFTRDSYSPLFCFFKGRVTWEVHELPKTIFGNILTTFLIRKCQLIVAPNKAVAQFCLSRGVSKDRVVYLPNGVDLKAFSIPLLTNKARQLLDLPPKYFLVGYMGSLYQRKGVDILIKSAALLPAGFKIVIFGGPDNEFRRIKDLIYKLGVNKRVLIFSAIPYKQVPIALRAMNVLVIPNSAKERLSSDETSPLKFREYLASKKPVVASDVPSLRELNPMTGQVRYFLSDDPKSLSQAILAATKMHKVFEIDKNISVKERARKLILKLR